LSRTEFLKKVKIGVTVRPDSNDLSIDDGSRWQIFKCTGDITEPIVECVPFSRVKSDVLFGSYNFKPIAIELDFLCGVPRYVALLFQHGR
jgi:hypothetical protein